ncbi:unnamed protein product [Schistosoma guineensis]|nr:unnamed protein product [Schistosoma guineensis]
MTYPKYAIPYFIDSSNVATTNPILRRLTLCYVTHETKHFIYFYMGNVAILLFKSG